MPRSTCLCVLLMLAASISVAQAQSQDRIRVVNEGGIREAWTLPPGSRLPVPGYPDAFAERQSEVCVALGYLINPDGHTSDFALLKAWSAKEPRQDRDRYWRAFAEVASAALAQWRFAPKPDVAVPRPVYTVATFVFGSANVLESSKRCAIPNLRQRIADLNQDSRARRRMNANDIFDRLELDPTREARYRGQSYLRENDARPHQPPITPKPQQPKPNPAAGSW